MVELRPDLAAIFRFLHGQGLDTRGADEDLGYGIHAWIAAAFGELAPKPWRLLLDQRRPPRVLGYSHSNAAQLRQRMEAFSTPEVFEVCGSDGIASKPMPEWQSGCRLAFELQCCPIGRKAGSGIEKDLFLIRADTEPNRKLSREAVYCDWVRDALQRDQAAKITSIRLAGFRLVRQTRQSQNGEGRRKQSHPVRPQATLQGELLVANPNSFTMLLAHGIGRHRSFGYGMLLLRPPA